MSAEKRKLNLENLLDEPPPAEDRFLDKCTDVGDQIYELMKGRGMSQRDLAESVGKSESYVSRLLAGGVNATLRTVTEFEEALDADVLVAPMYAGREEKPFSPRTFKKKTEARHYATPDAASYKKTAQGLKKAGFDMDACVLPAPNQSSTRSTWKRALATEPQNSAEHLEAEAAERELSTTA